MDDGNTITTRLLTLLNVSATKAGKRKRTYEDELLVGEKLNKRKSIQFDDVDKENSAAVPEDPDLPDNIENDVVAQRSENGEEEEEDEEEQMDNTDSEDPKDLYEAHFGVNPVDLTAKSRASVDERLWSDSQTKLGRIGSAVLSVPEGSQDLVSNGTNILERLATPFQSRQAQQPKEHTEYQNDLLSALATHRDLYLTSSPSEFSKSRREAISLHAINHVTKKRRRVLKNNERLTHAAKSKSDAPEDVQDQGFTRPSILILAPFRSSAVRWFRAITSHTPPPSFQIENQARFLSEYGLPPGAIDKIASAEPGTYPQDHVETFEGNVDDNFRLGIKLTRKSVKMFSEFYGSDIIIASPLALRISIEKEEKDDFLSSIEMAIIDQMDSLMMQNWDHVQFIFSRLNKLPKESHDTDFSRVKPWYLDGHAAFLRQTVLMSAFETPETRSLYNTSLKNVSGRLRVETRYLPIAIPDGIDQNFIHFDCPNPKEESDRRFNYFTTQLLPTVLKSAVQSANTVVFVPSSFDFIRVHNHFRKNAGVSFSVLSEYSSNADISRARQAFFSGKSAFLLISERFHYYRRYKIRGIRNLIFYGPPDHPQYFTELLSYPFLDDGVEASDVTCRVLYNKYDWFRLERVAGTEAALELIKS
ncbi:U3 small nucleolar RNA-associated protein 25 [Pleurotus pulmonarius]